MHSAWVKGLKGKDKEARIKQVLAYRNAFDDLKEILDRNFLKREADREYGEGWMQRQIAINEYNAVLENLIKLIDLNQEEK